MFTGLIEDLGCVDVVEPLPQGGLRLTLSAPLLQEPLPLGASLAVDGVCLTVVHQRGPQVTMELGPETLQRTTLGALRSGAPVNLERPLRLGDRLGGHMVAGHVDAVGVILSTAPRGDAWDARIGLPPALLRYVVEKGSVAVDGISLTVNRVDAEGFWVSLIPHTQERTTLCRKGAGTRVNIEVDLIGKYVERLLGGHLPGHGAQEQEMNRAG